MNINEIKAQEARETEIKIPIDSKTTKTIRIPREERSNPMTAKERLQYFVNGSYIGGLNLNRDIETLIEDYKLQEQYVKHLEQDKENMKKIINILCDIISQLI